MSGVWSMCVCDVVWGVKYVCLYDICVYMSGVRCVCACLGYGLCVCAQCLFKGRKAFSPIRAAPAHAGRPGVAGTDRDGRRPTREPSARKSVSSVPGKTLFCSHRTRNNSYRWGCGFFPRKDELST